MLNCGIILLAAGSSGRLGKPKQLLPYKKSTLLQYLMNEARASNAGTVVVVLGANEEIIQPELKTEGFYITVNKSWREGMASSIRSGIIELQKINPSTDAAILMVCDQPLVTSQLLNELISMHNKKGKPIVSSYYDDITGPPALFHQSMFPELLLLTGDKGAKKVVEIHTGNVATVPFPGGNIDIDTMADYEALTS
jgi:molybdenum cofactor cytidylyltransferase